MSSLEYRVTVGAGVPIVLAIVGILGKKLARGKGWRRADFYLGVEFTLAGVAAALASVFDLLLKPGRKLQAIDNELLLLNFLVAFIGMVLFMFVISLHQDYEDVNNTGDARKKEIEMLAGASNMLGFIMMLIGVLLMSV
jgi:hypothetical protein